jgi:hypothetical protein
VLLSNTYNNKKPKQLFRLFYKHHYFLIVLTLLCFKNYAQTKVTIKQASEIASFGAGGGVFSYNNNIIFSMYGYVPSDGNKVSNVNFLCDTNLDTLQTLKTSVLGNSFGNTYYLKPFGINNNSDLFYSGYCDNYNTYNNTHIFAKATTSNLNITEYKTYKTKSACYPGIGFKKMLNDSEFVITRNVYNGPNNTKANFSLWWLNKNLDMLNQNMYVNNHNFNLANCFKLQNKELLVTGNGDSVTVNDGFVMKLDSIGNIKWAKSIGTNGRDGFNSVKINNSIFLIGNTNTSDSIGSNLASYSELCLTKIDTGGSILKTFRITTDHVVYSEYTTVIGNYIVAAAVSFTTTGSGEGKGLFLKIDTNGIIQKQYVIGTAHTGNKMFSPEEITSDEQKNIYCNYQTWTNSSLVKNHLIKLDSNLVGCYPSEPAFNFTTTVAPVGFLHNLPMHFRVAKDSIYEVFGTINQGHGFNTIVDECSGYVSIEEHEGEIKNSSFKIYPNPATNLITLQSDEMLNNATIEISNAFGQIVLKQNNFNQKQDVNIEALQSGIYFINLYDKNKLLFKNKLSVIR